MAIGGSTAAPHVDIVKETRALQQATSPTYSPTLSFSPTSEVSSANTATTTVSGTNAGTAGGTEGGTTADAATMSMSTNGTVAMTGTGATVDVGSTSTGATLSTMTTTPGAATSDSKSWMVCNKDLATSTSLNNEMLTLYHHVALAPEGDSRGGIFCGWLERTDGTDGWFGFGMSPDGEMADGIGMIGLPDDGTVEKYRLYGESPFVERMSDDKQTLMFTSITQDQDGTRMEFAKFLNEEDELPILANGSNTFLYALGGSNELGFHSSGMDSFKLDLETPAASSTTTSATISATTVTDTASTTFAIEATATAPSNEESTKATSTPAPMEFASGDKSTASAIARVTYSISGALALCALLKL